MSYARFGPTSDVYVYEARRADVPVLHCCSCTLTADDVTQRVCFEAGTAVEMDDHLLDHVAAGDMVPANLIGSMLDPGAAGELLIVAEDAAKS